MIDRLDLHAYVDGELTSEQQATLSRDLASSPKELEEVRAIQALKKSLREKALAPQSELLWQRCVGRLDEIDKTRRVERVVGKYAPALCAVMFVVIVVAGQFSHPTDRGNVSSPDLARMVGSLAPMHPPKQLGRHKNCPKKMNRRLE
jgi:anti-sigma factor RsiW